MKVIGITVFLILIVVVLCLLFLWFLKHLDQSKDDKTGEYVRDCYDTFFWLQQHLKESDNKNFKLAAIKLDKALDILIEVEQMVQEPEEDEKTKELRQKYDELVAGIEDARMFDGRGKGIDVYICDNCGARFYTQYVDKGVTPFVTKCRSCEHGSAVHKETISLHQWVRLEEQGEKLHSWVRPTFEQFLKLSPATQEHILNGGLILREKIAE